MAEQLWTVVDVLAAIYIAVSLSDWVSRFERHCDRRASSRTPLTSPE